LKTGKSFTFSAKAGKIISTPIAQWIAIILFVLELLVLF